MKVTLKDMYGVSKVADLHSLFAEKLQKARSKDDAEQIALEMMPYIWLGKAPNTVVNKYTELQNLCKTLGKKGEWVLHIFNYPDPLVYARNKKNEEKVIERIENKEEVDVESYKEKYKEIKKILKDRSYEIARNQTEDDVRAYYLSVAIAMATGRRITEILKTLDIKKRGTKLTFSGLLKKRGGEEEKRGYIIFDEYKEVKKMLKELRSILTETKNMTNQEVGRKYNGKFNNFLQTKIFPEVEDISFKELRAIYATIAWEDYIANGGDMEKEQFFRNLLGHEFNISTAEHYMTKKGKK